MKVVCVQREDVFVQISFFDFADYLKGNGFQNHKTVLFPECNKL